MISWEIASSCMAVMLPRPSASWRPFSRSGSRPRGLRRGRDGRPVRRHRRRRAVVQRQHHARCRAPVRHGPARPGHHLGRRDRRAVGHGVRLLRDRPAAARVLGDPPLRRGLPHPRRRTDAADRRPVPDDPGAATVPIDKATERADPGWYAATPRQRRRRPDGGRRPGRACSTSRYPADAGVPAADQGVRQPGRHLEQPGPVPERPRGRGARDQRRLLRSVRPSTPCTCSTASTARSAAHGTWDGGAWVEFGQRPAASASRSGVSFVDAAGARRNLDAAGLGWSVERLGAEAAAVWDRELSRIQRHGRERRGARPVRRPRCTTRCCTRARSATPTAATPGMDGEVHRLPRRRAPAQRDLRLGLLPHPGAAARLAAPRRRLAGGPLAAPRRASSSGYLPTLAARRLRDRRHERRLRCADRGDGVRVRRPRLAARRPGHPARPAGPGRGRPAATPRRPTLEYALDDFAVSRLARVAGRDAAGRPLPRSAPGGVAGPGLDRDRVRGGQRRAVHLGRGARTTSPGCSTTIDDPRTRLDDFFTELNAGAVPPHAWLGNQPSLGTPWVYHWLGEPARTQDVVDRARAELWTTVRRPGCPATTTSARCRPGTSGPRSASTRSPPGRRTSRSGSRRSARSWSARSAASRPASCGPANGAHVGGLTVDGTDEHPVLAHLGPDRPTRSSSATTDDADPAWGTAPGDAPPSYPSR